MKRRRRAGGQDAARRRVLFGAKPTGLVRLLFRLPVHLYRRRMGFILGHRFLLLTHQGRKTGQPRQTVLEVLRYDPTTRESVVISALGERADWYRNIQARPALLIQAGRQRYVPQQHLLSTDEAYEFFTSWERQHPLEARLAALVLGWDYDGSPASRRALAESLRLVAFRPRTEPTRLAEPAPAVEER